MDMISDAELRAIVEKVVQRTLHGPEGRVENHPPVSPAQPAAPGRVGRRSLGADGQPAPVKSPENITQKNVALGADHGGFKMKEMLKAHLIKAGYQVNDCGTHSTESVDYPDIAFVVADMVRSGKAWRGIVIDGAGIGSCMVANKVPGVRAAMCYDHATAVNSREHNDANVLTLGAGLIGENLARQIVDIWLTTEFGGGRHARRVDKITAVETKS